MLDVDYFKSINDAFGHSRGDQALAEVAARIKAQVRLSDEIFRYGGDEFVILLPQTSKQQAIILAQRILNHVNELPLMGDPPLALSVSIGIASYPEDGDTPQRLFEIADHRHYQSKILGRARVVSQDVDIPNGQPANGGDRLIERDHALSQLKQFTDMLETAPRGILHVTGQRGIGHTRFLREVRNIFRLRGYASLWLSGRTALQSRMYGAIIEAFQAWENPPQVINTESVETYLADFIKQKKLNGLVLLLDDWQCLDDASMTLINHLYRSNQLKHVALAYAGEEHDSMSWIESEKDELFTIALLPLTETGVRVWLRQTIGQEAPEELIRLMIGLTGGLPAHLAHVIQWMASEEKRNLENQNYVTVLAHLQNEYEHILEDANLPPNNLPENMPVFLDREAEINQIKKFLKEKRLVTLTGTGGVGKTRLALQVAGEILDQYKDGIFFVPLDSISSPAFIIDAISQAMKFGLDPERDTPEQFFAYLSSKHILLILDNFETVLDKANLLQQISERAPAVRILVTSRERLNLPGETVLEIGGLSFPAPDSTDIEQYPAVRLFMQYARLQPDFEPDLVSIGRICRLVDGIPLGIELASAWVSTLSSEQIALSIEQNLSFLSSFEGPEYHRNLMAIFDSLWELFSKNEMRVLMGLGIFKGGFSYQAAAKITGASPFFLDALANKLLLYRRGANRYALHATFSQYLLEKLRADPLFASHIEAQHNLFYLGYLRESEIALQRSASASLISEILADIENIRTAWNQMVTAGNFRALESTLSAWMVLLRNRGWFREAIDDLLELDAKVPESAGGVSDVELFGIRIKSLLGEFYYHIGDYEAGIRELQDALHRAKMNGYHREEAEIYRLLGNNYSAIGRHQDAKEMYQLGLAIAEKRRDLYLVYQFMNSLGVRAYKESDFEAAIPAVKRALRIARKLENRSNIAQSLNNLGNLYYVTGDCPRARKMLSKALTYLPDVESQTLKGSILDTMGKALTGCEEFTYASQIFSQGLKLVRDIEATPLVVEMLVSIAELFDNINEKPMALTLIGLATEHPAASSDVKTRAARLRENLTAENVEPADRKWRADQISRVLKDLIQILDQKSAESYQ
jgi:diguanylate cyclase (GGDEF)-like protein